MLNSRKRKLGTVIEPSEDVINEYIRLHSESRKESGKLNSPSMSLNSQQEEVPAKVSKLSNMVVQSKPKKFAAIICEDADKWGGQDELGKKMIEVFKQNDNEIWEYFKACSDELPDKNKLEGYEAFIVSGSRHSANDNTPWLEHLEAFVKAVFELHTATDKGCPKLIGICFGHQLIGKALGAKVTKNVGGRFIFKPVDIKTSESLNKTDYFQKVFPDQTSFVLFQSHSEEVIDLPSCGECVASSYCCENEIVKYGDSVLTIQGHMEITVDEMLENILPAIKNANIFNEEEENEMFCVLKEKSSDREKVVDLIKAFIYDKRM